jgi:23S rRNA (cytidine1920-2'-O)/16S rRNA (cytidine1409-2'-O)-methyltransferase
LVKPQFEAAREDVDEGGIVRSESVRHAALERVRAGMRESGFFIEGTCESPIRGKKGNIEYLMLGSLFGTL